MAILTNSALQVLNTKTFPDGVTYKDAILRKKIKPEGVTLVKHANNVVRKYLESLAGDGHKLLKNDSNQEAEFE